ncbi:MAG: hypothetical protein BGO29_08760 [Bacteroidales bacterium 36-12]|nr:MAG: hypothetical protein BGO29_08760 [Bacteroidales bacterium 36-12]
MTYKNISFHLLLLLALLSVKNINGQIKINEIMSNNVSAVIDNSYNYSMWVEVFNSSASETINIRDYYFTDDLSDINKWRPPIVRIAPGGFAVLWFEREDKINHANFKLNPEGGKLYLINKSGEVADMVEYPAQHRNTSFGRIQDGANEWVYFSEYSNGASNNGKKWSATQCSTPKFITPGGFYKSGFTCKFETPATGETIYFTTDGREPNTTSSKYNAQTGINITKTSIVRAICLSNQKLPGQIASATYFINERTFNLPVSSIITDNKNLTDNTIGIYVKGTNGIPGNGTNEAVNWNQDWSRPANYELFDVNGNSCLNQELDIAISGGWSRTINPQKSLKISPRKKFGDNRLRYDIFWASKPNRKYKDIQIRNSGNDFANTMMRDGFMQTLVANRMNIDYLAYQPAVCFMNGQYYGIQNLRERSNKDYLYSNYDLDEEDFYLLDHTTVSKEPFTSLVNYVRNNDITNTEIYNSALSMVDVENLIDYYIAQMFFNNTDWPHNNLKTWKKKDNGQWRWILYDTDFGFNLHGENQHNDNTVTHVQNASDPSSVVFKRLMLNPIFKSKFLDRVCIHISSTFETNRVNNIMDSLANAIRKEFVYHKQRWGGNNNFEFEINKMKQFSLHRPNSFFTFITNQYNSGTPYQSVDISSNADKNTYLINSEEFLQNKINLKYFKNRQLSIEAIEHPGLKFKYWEVYSSVKENILIPLKATWDYWDRNGKPSENWYKAEYSSSSWSNARAPFGYGANFPSVTTTISYGGNTGNKYITSYFRKTFNVSDPSELDNIQIAVYVDDGVAVYINDVEIGRYNLPSGKLEFNTLTNTYNNGEWVYFDIPQSFLKKGNNVIAAEVHQVNATSSDMVFELTLTSKKTDNQFTTQTNPKFFISLNNDIKLKAIFEEVELTDPFENSQIVLNEIVASNSFVQDEYNEYDDYIEIYNKGEESVNIAGWYLSDNPSNLTLSRIPDTEPSKTTIPAKGRIIIWADEQVEQGVLHANFKISKDGETITISRKNPYEEIVIVDEITIPELAKDMSYSRYPDGGDEWVVQVPTFNRSNADFSSTELIEKKNIIFPTLVSSHFNVSDSEGEMIRIIDISGKIILEQKCSSDYETIYIDNLQKGVYFVNVGNRTIKIIKTL